MPSERYPFHSRYVPFDSTGRKIRYAIFVVLVYVIPLLGAFGSLFNSSSNLPLENQTANHTSTTPPTTLKPTSPASLGNQTANHTSLTTPKPTSPVTKYEWELYTPKLWNDTRLVKTNGTNSNSYVVAHSIHNENMSIVVSANINLQDRTIKPLYQISYIQPTIKVLLVEPGHYEWIKSSNGTVEKNAIEVKKNKNETVYVCRIENNAGWMTPSERRCNLDSIQAFNSTYDLLIYKI